ncbi:MAG: sugar phosphate isomerase/epimerase family protein [Phycisphaerales bacterium]
MFRTAFSTVACPDWTLERAATAAAEWGYDGVELRTFGYGSADLACDPALTAGPKVRRVFSERGVQTACLATGVRFDEPITPPVIGRVIRDTEKSVRQGKAAVDLAAQIECPYVRVFGFEFPRGERRKTAVARIEERLRMVLDGARHTGVKVVLENGGSFPRAADLADVIDRIASPLLGAAYSAPVAFAAGEDPAEGARELGGRLWVAKLKDYSGGVPCPLGQGDVPCAAFVRSLAERGFAGWLVCEWDRLWLPDLVPAEAVLPSAVKRVYEWAGAGAAPRAVPQHA